MFLIGFVLIIVGILQIAFPAEAYMFGKRWQFRGNVEPSEAMIVLTRFGGIVAVIIGVVMSISSCSQ